MTTISATIIKHSVSLEGVRLTTMHLRYPRFIHAEVMTHRVFSRNARSSRAVPIKTMIQEVMDDPVVPLHWGKAQKGMQAYEETDALVKIEHGNEYHNYEAWLRARDEAVLVAQGFADAGYHKQIVNRLLEPFMHIDVLVTATDWSNFFALRDHHAAEPHIQMLARAMDAAMRESRPVLLQPGQWHLPYIEESEVLDQEIALKISAARCARISYTPFDGNASYEAELKRYDLLMGETPRHASPTEHQATPDSQNILGQWRNPNLHGNLRGWVQFRKTIPEECL